MRAVAVLLLLVLAGCSSAPVTPAPDPASDSWIALVPGDARVFDGPAGELVLIYIDETYAIDGVNASALTWELDDHYTTDYFHQDDDGAVWWYGRRGSWRAGRHGEEPRRIEVDGGRARFGDRTIVLSEGGDPVRVETPDGEFARRQN